MFIVNLNSVLKEARIIEIKNEEVDSSNNAGGWACIGTFANKKLAGAEVPVGYKIN